MAALTSDSVLFPQYSTPPSPLPPKRTAPIAASTIIYAGAIVALNSSGYAVPYSTTGSCIQILGRAAHQVNNSTAGWNYLGGSAGAGQVEIDVGCFALNIYTDSTITFANNGAPLYAVDDNNVSLFDGGGTRLFAGYVVYDPSVTSGKVFVQLGFGSPYAPANSTGGSSNYKARAVVTTLAAYGGTTTGILTATANGAFGTQDGVSTLAVGDVVFVQEGTTNLSASSDAGPYVITALGATGSKWVLTRPLWWETGATIVEGTTVDISGEGTLWANATWKATCAKSQVVDTNDAKWYPGRVTQQVQLAAGVLAITNVPILSASKTQFLATLEAQGGTSTSVVAYLATTVTPGAIGTATFTVKALESGWATTQTGDTSTLNVTVINW
jgi:hypothetical protein